MPSATSNTLFPPSLCSAATHAEPARAAGRPNRPTIKNGSAQQEKGFRIFFVTTCRSAPMKSPLFVPPSTLIPVCLDGVPPSPSSLRHCHAPPLAHRVAPVAVVSYPAAAAAAAPSKLLPSSVVVALRSSLKQGETTQAGERARGRSSEWL